MIIYGLTKRYQGKGCVQYRKYVFDSVDRRKETLHIPEETLE